MEDLLGRHGLMSCKANNEIEVKSGHVCLTARFGVSTLSFLITLKPSKMPSCLSPSTNAPHGINTIPSDKH
ncbi:hypothetical protein TIFTF001_025348 [Ficus carica]|uniref:Uncharacterized protein n=1 Tax=Ficus carica TaxID=3494 RepID=A0AA88AP09_FICCA|nr:hypothetical protein TIFTF001_025348 [Ficus carica]